MADVQQEQTQPAEEHQTSDASAANGASNGESKPADTEHNGDAELAKTEETPAAASVESSPSKKRSGVKGLFSQLFKRGKSKDESGCGGCESPKKKDKSKKKETPKHKGKNDAPKDAAAAEQPADKPAEQPAEQATEQPAVQPTEAVHEQPAVQSAEAVNEKPHVDEQPAPVATDALKVECLKIEDCVAEPETETVCDEKKKLADELADANLCVEKTDDSCRDECAVPADAAKPGADC